MSSRALAGYSTAALSDETQNETQLVSVVMPAYNVGDYIGRALESVLSQIHDNLEICVVDDGSTDSTRFVIEKFARQDKRVKPIFHDRNYGVSAARNTAIDHARGDWLAVVDPDDWIAPERLEKLLNVAQSTGADAVADNQHFVHAKTGETFGQLMPRDSLSELEMTSADFLNNDLPEENGYGLLKMMIRRSFIDKHGLRYRAEFPRGQDCVFYCECLSNGARVFLTPTPMYYYRFQRLGSTTRNTIGVPTMESLLHVQEAVEKIFGQSTPHVTEALARRRELILECLHYRRVIDPLKQRQFHRAASEFFREPAYAGKFVQRLSGAAWRRVTGKNPPTAVVVSTYVWLHEWLAEPTANYTPIII